VTRIGFDVDGVFADFVWAFTNVLFTQTDGEFKPYRTAEQEEWKFACTDEEYERTWAVIAFRMNWWMTLEPLLSHATTSKVNELISNNEVFFITSRKSLKRGLSAQAQTEYWLEGVGVDAAHATVITTKSSKKGDLLEALDIEYYLDDKEEIVEQIAASDWGGILCVKDWSYNRSEYLEGLYHKRFDTVDGYVDYVTEQTS